MMSLVGEVVLDLLEQDTVWRTSDGRVIELVAMDARHRANVLRMLEMMASDLYADSVTELLVEGLDYAELAVVGAYRSAPVTCEHEGAEVRAWFERQPLIRRLRALGAGSSR